MFVNHLQNRNLKTARPPGEGDSRQQRFPGEPPVSECACPLLTLLTPFRRGPVTRLT